MVKAIGLIFFLHLYIANANELQRIVNKVNEVEEYEGVCSISIERHLIRSEVVPSNKTVPSFTKCTFSAKDNSSSYVVETLMCSNGLWLSMIQEKGTSTENHMLSKRACWPFLPLFFLFPPAGLIYSAIFCRKKRSSPPPAPNRPPNIKCPSVPTTKYADKLEHTAVVSWSNPTASDPEGTSVRISRSSGQHSGSKFGNGNHAIVYTAEDNVKNKATCSIRFQVKVQYCLEDLYVENGRPLCNTTDNVYGTDCTLICKTGYQFPANSTEIITCKRISRHSRSITPGLYSPFLSYSYHNNDVQWYPSSQHFCEKMVCPEPESPCNGKLICSFNNTYEFESTCYPVCDDGYSTDQSQSITCNGSYWIGSIKPCKDIQPPEFNNCPSNIKKFADRAKTTTSVTWIIPSATDNSQKDENCGTNSSIEINQVLGKPPGSQFEVGFHSLSYAAEDTSNNIGYCNFSVIIEELSCDPLVLTDTYVLQRCPDGYMHGSGCYFNCTLGYRLMGDQNVTCEKNETVKDLAFWAWSNYTEVYCDKLRCPDLPAPAGGALACSEALGNQICVMSCSDKYQVAKGTPPQYVCGDTQEWIPGIPPNCTDRVHPKNVVLPGELFYYYSGDCSNTSVQEGIKNNFVNVMHNMEKEGWDNICPSYCTVEGVTVKCGPLNGRRKREANLRHKVRRALTDVGAGTMSKIEVNFLLNMEYLPNSSFAENDNLVTDVGNMIVRKANEGIFNVDSLLSPNLAFGWSELACNGTGVVPDYNEGTCVGCAPGKFLKGDNCIECKKGYYQDEEYQVECKPCPEGLSSVGNGSSSIEDCVEVCKPGTFSPFGVQPCSPCKIGYFQPQKGSTECIQCKSNKYTESTGSTECTEIDVAFMDSYSLIKMPRLTFSLDSFTLGFFVKPRNSSNSLRISMSNLTVVIGKQIDLYYSSSRHIGVKYLYSYKWTQICVTSNQRESTTKLYVNGENVGLKRSRDFHITIRSQLKILSKDPGSRLTGLFLITTALQDSEIADISSICNAPQQEYTFVYNLGAIFLAENTGVQFLKSKCDAIDDCRDNPCGNNNLCTDELDNYTCTCYGGYSGTNCEIPPDFCVGNLCQHSATCVTHFSNYTCTCANGFTGVLCDTKIVNGNWGSWLAWSECSASCNGGLQYRLRLCTDPPPDPYGLDCAGSNISQQICNSEDCPVCPHYMTIYSYKNNFECLSEGDTVSCNVTCQDGYVFVDSYYPLEHYECGPSTDYRWNGKPPLCCLSPALMELVNKVIDLSLSVAQLNDSTDLLVVSLNGSTYLPDMSLLSNIGDVICDPGFVVNDAFLCAECPSGTYWEDDTCKLCPVGSYQDLSGQLLCLLCPPGLTTHYIASNSSGDCVKDNTYTTTVISSTKSTTDKVMTTSKGVVEGEDSKTDIIIIAVAVTVLAILLIVCVTFIWQYREHLRHLARKRAFGSITSLDMVHPELSIYVTPDTPPVKRIFKPPPEEGFTTDFHHSHDGQFVHTYM